MHFIVATEYDTTEIYTYIPVKATTYFLQYMDAHCKGCFNTSVVETFELQLEYRL